MDIPTVFPLFRPVPPHVYNGFAVLPICAGHILAVMRRDHPERQDGRPTIAGYETGGSSEFQAQNRGQIVQSLGLHLPTDNFSEASEEGA